MNWMSGLGLVHRLDQWYGAGPVYWIRPVALPHPHARSSTHNTYFTQSRTQQEEPWQACLLLQEQAAGLQHHCYHLGAWQPSWEEPTCWSPSSSVASFCGQATPVRTGVLEPNPSSTAACSCSDKQMPRQEMRHWILSSTAGRNPGIGAGLLPSVLLGGFSTLALTCTLGCHHGNKPQAAGVPTPMGFAQALGCHYRKVPVTARIRAEVFRPSHSYLVLGPYVWHPPLP